MIKKLVNVIKFGINGLFIKRLTSSVWILVIQQNTAKLVY